MFNLFKEKLKTWTKKISKTIGVEEKKTKKKEKAPKEKKSSKEKKKKVVVEVQEKEETKSFFQTIAEKVSQIQKVKLSDKDFEVYSEELETLLLENNVDRKSTRLNSSH